MLACQQARAKKKAFKAEVNSCSTDVPQLAMKT